MFIDKPFMIGPWKVEPDLDRVVRGSEKRAVRPQVMNLLVYLAALHGSLARSEQLIRDLWPNKVITDATLYNCVAELRRVLDEGRDNQRYVETVHKKGYRLLEPVVLLEDEPSTSLRQATNNSEAQKSLALGIERLSRHNLEGWQQAETYFKRTVQLDPNCFVAWQKLAQSIVSQFPTFQKSVDQLHEALAAADRAIELDADSGLALMTKAHAELAIALAGNQSIPRRRLLRLCRQALELEPKNAEVEREFGLFLIRANEDQAAAIKHTEASVQLDPLSATNRYALGRAYRLAGQATEALATLRRACELKPDDPYPIWEIGLTFYHMGNLADALWWGSKAFRYERDDPSGPYLLAHVFMNLGLFDLAEEWIKTGMSYAPNAPIAFATRMSLAAVRGETGMISELATKILPHAGEMRLVHAGTVAQALWLLRDRDIKNGQPDAALDRYKIVVPSLFEDVTSDRDFWLLPALDVAYLYRIMGDEPQAQRLLERVYRLASEEKYVERELDHQWLLVEANLLLGDRQEAERLLRKSVRPSWIRWWQHIHTRPTIDAIRDSQAFADATVVIEIATQT